MDENPTTPQAIDLSLVKPAWIVIFAGWLVACVGGSVLAVVNLTRNIVGIGLAQLACAVIGTFFFYWLGLTIFAGAVISALSG